MDEGKLTREQKDLHENKVLEMLIPALSKHLTAKEGWKFLDTVNPILYKSGSPWIYMIFGDGLAVTLAENMRRAGNAVRKAEKIHGSSMGWNEDTFTSRSEDLWMKYRLLNSRCLYLQWPFIGGYIELHWIDEETHDEILTYGVIQTKL